MVPAAYVRVEAFPLTSSGKIDRRALPTPRPAANDPVEPATETERAIAEVWSEVLDVDAVGRFDDFFELGGHSLSAIRAAARTSSALGVRLGVDVVFLRRTVEQVALEADRLGSAGTAPDPPLRRLRRELA